MNLVGRAKPPTQYLYGSGLVWHYNPDTADCWPVVYLRRRARKLAVGGAVAGPRVTVVYECRVDGDVYRIDEDGERKRVPEGHAEWWWAHDAVLAIRERQRYPRSMWRHAVPPDCTAWGTRASSGGEHTSKPVTARRHW